MTTETADAEAQDDTMGEKLERLNANLATFEELSQRLVKALASRDTHDHGLQGPGQDVYLKAATAYMTEMMANPAKLIEHQMGYWNRMMKHLVAAQAAIAAGKPLPEDEDLPRDRRFNSPMWDANPFFAFLKQQYLLSAKAVDEAVQDLDGLSAGDKQRVEFFARQIVDMMAPTNFLATNPEALHRAVETDGQSLIDGMQNLISDLESNRGDLLVTLSDPDAFTVGENLATTPGSVVFRNRMFELVQYAPTTDKVHRTPLILFPPWINKFYILDLKEKNSLVKWIVDQGFTLFVVSWVNPDASYADVGLDTYVEEGYLTAVEQVKAITGEDKVNAIGYCIAGTTLNIALALMAKRGDKSVRSATFFTTLADFADPGEMGVFLENDFVDGIEREVAEKGYLHSFFMSRTFSYLRANDLVYGPAVRHYMMGETPKPFDLLHWNGDSTNLAGRFVVEYLRTLCQNNELAEGSFTLCGETLSLKDVKVPVFDVACETDHIAHWRGCFASLKGMGSRDKTLVLSESGHIAGIVNPPSKMKYGHYTSDVPLSDPDAWMAAATKHEGSWWPRWGAWLVRRSGAKVAARTPGGPEHPVLCPAPGTYVQVRGTE